MTRPSVIVLGGLSHKNEAFVQTLSEEFSKFTPTQYLAYDHWKTDGHMDFDAEIKKLVETIGRNTNFILVAKSAGILVCLKAIMEHGIVPKHCFFFGTPVTFSKTVNMSFEELMKYPPANAVFIQNEHDPAYSASELKPIVESKKCTLITLAGSTHEYAVQDVLDIVKGTIK
ncbi:MAG TPA: hypothetical protein VK158_01795 [Acidobacteriota bacterium]|nr:hypothetical protein [Acidobacteriota bacterium]